MYIWLGNTYNMSGTLCLCIILYNATVTSINIIIIYNKFVFKYIQYIQQRQVTVGESHWRKKETWPWQLHSGRHCNNGRVTDHCAVRPIYISTAYTVTNELPSQCVQVPSIPIPQNWAMWKGLPAAVVVVLVAILLPFSNGTCNSCTWAIYMYC